MHPDELEALARRVMAETDKTFGRYPGYRAAQAKGTLCRGWFTSSGEAAGLTSAAHFRPGAVTPVSVRFSNAATNPLRRDAALDVRGLSAAFHLSETERTDIIALRMARFVVGTAEEFLRFQRQMVRNPWGDLPLWGWRAWTYGISGRLPRPGVVWQLQPLCRIPTYAACRYNSLHAFRWLDRNGGSRYVRYTWVPGAGEDRLRWWRRYRARDHDYLRQELAERLAQGPVRFRLEVQIASGRDSVDNASKTWDKHGPRVTAGILELTEMGSWGGADGRPLVFDPTRMTAGIQLSPGDSLMQLRRYVYEMSARRREGRPAGDRAHESAGDPPPAPPGGGFPQKAYVNGVDIAYATDGHPGGRPLLLIMGFACPMTWWRDEFIKKFTDLGYYVIRLDNRDCGQSERVGKKRNRILGQIFPRWRAPYTVDDMAEDAADLLQEIGVKAAHVVGISLGGMIAQSMAIHFPERVLSLSCISSAPKFKVWPPHSAPTMRVTLRLARLSFFPGRTMEKHVKRSLPLWRRLNGKHFTFEEQNVRELLELAWRWSGGADSRADFRQILAVRAARNRTRALRDVRVPAFVIHGSSDPLVRVAGGRATAKALNVEPVIVPGMGHYTPQETWDRIVAGVHAAAEQSERAVRERIGAAA
jgi:pimeloyl-ACP methyl ester carboxylesterase